MRARNMFMVLTLSFLLVLSTASIVAAWTTVAVEIVNTGHRAIYADVSVQIAGRQGNCNLGSDQRINLGGKAIFSNSGFYREDLERIKTVSVSHKRHDWFFEYKGYGPYFVDSDHPDSTR